MNKRKNEIQAILLATIALFIFISLFSFKIEYNISDILSFCEKPNSGNTGIIYLGLLNSLNSRTSMSRQIHTWQ